MPHSVCAKYVSQKYGVNTAKLGGSSRGGVSSTTRGGVFPSSQPGSSSVITRRRTRTIGYVRVEHRDERIQTVAVGGAPRPTGAGVQRGASKADVYSGRHRDRSFTAAATSAYSAEESDPTLSEPVPAVFEALPVASDLKSFLLALYRFSRPHTIYGTAISVVSISLLAVPTLTDLHPAMLYGIMQALIPALLMNVAIVGLNQLYDIEIDKVNKPYLPLASGELTPQMGEWIVGVTAVTALLLGVWSGSLPLQITLGLSLALGVVYSVELPFLRWKRFPFLAAACILVVRAVLVQLGFYFHLKVVVLGGQALVTPSVLFATGFMCLCSIVIALFKDLPDVKGDRMAQVNTLSVRLGVDRVFNICRGLLAVAYTGGILVGLCSPSWINSFVLVGFHSLAAFMMWTQSRTVDLSSSKSLYAFYMLIWKLFYAEYLVLPFLR